MPRNLACTARPTTCPPERDPFCAYGGYGRGCSAVTCGIIPSFNAKGLWVRPTSLYIVYQDTCQQTILPQGKSHRPGNYPYICSWSTSWFSATSSVLLSTRNYIRYYHLRQGSGHSTTPCSFAFYGSGIGKSKEWNVPGKRFYCPCFTYSHREVLREILKVWQVPIW